VGEGNDFASTGAAWVFPHIPIFPMVMTPEQRAEITRLLHQLCASAAEARVTFDSPQVFLRGGYMEDHPERSIELLRALVDIRHSRSRAL
jgi:hypothetical protein